MAGSTTGSHYYFGVSGDDPIPAVPKNSEYLIHYKLNLSKYGSGRSSQGTRYALVLKSRLLCMLRYVM